jgi:hypothetical protein
MAGRNCHNCVYSICDPERWLRWIWRGAPIVPQCANHPFWPGQLHDVPGVPCRNYRPKPTEPKGDIRWISLGDGRYTYVDAADYEWLRRWHWRAYSTGYAGRYENGKLVYMHRKILPPPPGMIVDHISGNVYDNTRGNLRLSTRRQNMYNKGKQVGTASIYKGVCYSKTRRKWYAHIRFGKERFRMGYFDTEAEAARAYDRKAVELFGTYARLNFPEEWPPERRAQVQAQRQEDGAKRNVIPARAGKRKKTQK